MSRTQNENVEEKEFVLKHRIAGAAFLLFFGALFVPWLLNATGGSNNVAVKKNNQQTNKQISSKEKEELTSKQIEAELLTEAKTQPPVEEHVYISKITPVSKPQVIAEITPKKVIEKPLEKKQIEKQPEEKTPFETTPKAESKKQEAEAKEPVEAKPKPVVKSVVKAEPKVTPKPEAKKVEVGWILSVGVFADPKNVAAIVKDLKSKGFDNPSTSSIMTSKGKATRVWLGPFEQRVNAGKAKTQLKSKIGISGLIKAYP